MNKKLIKHLLNIAKNSKFKMDREEIIKNDEVKKI